MNDHLPLLRAELHLLNEQEAAALCRALQLRRQGDERGSMAELAEVDRLRVRRGDVQRAIRELVGPPILV